MVEKSPWHPISYVRSKFKCLQLIWRWKWNFLRINIVFRTRVKKWTCFELLIENWHVLKSCSFFVKNHQDMKKLLNKIATQTSLQLLFFSIMSTILAQWCVIVWDNQWNMSDWVKYGVIRIFSDTYFCVYVLGFCPYIGKCGLEKILIFAYLL